MEVRACVLRVRALIGREGIVAPYLELATLYTASCKVELHRPKSGYSDRTPHIYMRCPEGGGGWWQGGGSGVRVQ